MFAGGKERKKYTTPCGGDRAHASGWSALLLVFIFIKRRSFVFVIRQVDLWWHKVKQASGLRGQHCKSLAARALKAHSP